MRISSGIAASGLTYASRVAEVTANNLSNLNSQGFKASKVSGVDVAGGGVRAEVTLSTSAGRMVADGSGGTTELSNVNLDNELVQLQGSPLMYTANLAVLGARDAMVGELLDRAV